MISTHTTEMEQMKLQLNILFPLLNCWCPSMLGGRSLPSSSSSMRRCSTFWLNIRFRMFCSYHLRSCVITFLSWLYNDETCNFEQVIYEQQAFFFCTITQPRGGGNACSGHTRKAHIKFAFTHLQLRHGSTVGTSEPFANRVLLWEQPKTVCVRSKEKKKTEKEKL